MFFNRSETQPAVIASPATVARIFKERIALNDGIPKPHVAVSGAFDVLHIGHIKYIHAAALLKGDTGLLVAIVNGDRFLMHKKGYVFMPLEERLELISHLRGVDYVVATDDDTHTVIDALRIIKPNIFAKGGEITQKNVPENEVCEEIGCSLVFGIGGHTKVQSSSLLVEKYQHPIKLSDV